MISKALKLKDHEDTDLIFIYLKGRKSSILF